MNEKPKSIWKKPWRFPKLLWLWLVLMVATMLIVLTIILVNNLNFPLAGILVSGAVGATVFLALWLFIRWLWCWRNFKRSLFALTCFITLIALFYAEENWRGKHDWKKFQHEWAAKGEKFDWQSIVPPPVPDDQNFAFSPVWIADNKFNFRTEIKRAKAWYGDQVYSLEVSNISSLFPVSISTIVGTNMWNFPSPPGHSSTWISSRFLDLKPFQSYYRNLGKTNLAAHIIIAPQPQTPAQDVLLALSKFDPVIEQLRRDSGRPDSRFPIQYNNGMPAAILLPHLAAEKRFAEVLQLRAIAELQNGENEKAFADIKLMMRLIDASHNEPFLICHLVRISILNLTLQPIWEALAERKWSDAQLVELDSELAKLDFIADNESANRGEQNLEIANIEFLRHPYDLNSHRPLLSYIAPIFYILQGWSGQSESGDSEPSNFQMFALALGPSGWLDQNELFVAQFNAKWYLPIVNIDEKTISPTKAHVADDARKQTLRQQTPENVLGIMFLPVLGNSIKKFAYAQSVTDLARVSLALERYRLANGNYPESLDALAPKFNAEGPHDVIGGGPLKYRRTSDGQFVLYSVGWNERDDGGVVVFKEGKTPAVDISQGDWVWRYPEK